MGFVAQPLLAVRFLQHLTKAHSSAAADGCATRLFPQPVKPVLLGMENALQFKRKLIPAKRRGAMAILPTTQGGQPPASVLHRECIKNGDLRPDELGCELPSLFRGNGGIEKNKAVCASPHIFRRD